MARFSLRWRRFLELAIRDIDSYVAVQVPVKDGDEAVCLKVADCDNIIRIWFPWASDNSLKISRHKVAILREALDKIEAGVERLHKSQ